MALFPPRPKAQVGSISHGTLRDRDLIEAFVSELNYLRRDNSTPREIAICEEANRWLALPDNDETAGDTISDLIDALNERAPAYCYFGAHEGDGSDFGFWPCLGEIDELPCYESTSDARQEGETGDFRTVTDHGNVTVWYLGDDGEAIEILALV